MPWLFLFAILILGWFGYLACIIIHTGGHAVIIYSAMLIGMAGVEFAITTLACTIGTSINPLCILLNQFLNSFIYWYIVLAIYNWMVVYSYYHQLLEKKDQPFEEDADSISYIKYP
jgi:hypothetical protein